MVQLNNIKETMLQYFVSFFLMFTKGITSKYYYSFPTKKDGQKVIVNQNKLG